MNSSVISSRNPALDGLRGIAVAMVVVAHYVVGPYVRRTEPLSGVLAPIEFLGTAGVNLFFVLSGFLLTGILLDNLKSDNLFQVFYVRRACRILPPYVALLLTVGIGSMFVSAFNLPFTLLDATPLWAYATFTQNIVWAFGINGSYFLMPTWSLAVEEQFYLFLPQAVRRLSRGALLFLLIGMWGLGIYARVVSPEKMNNFLLPWRIDGLMAGSILAVLIRAPGGSNVTPAILRMALTVFGVSLISGALAGMLDRIPWFIFEAWLTFTSVLLVFWAFFKGPEGGLLVKSPLVWLGGISYGVYLYHQLIHLTLSRLIIGEYPRSQSFGDAAVAVLAVAVTLLLSHFSHKWIERPAMKFGHRFRYSTPSSVPIDRLE